MLTRVMDTRDKERVNKHDKVDTTELAGTAVRSGLEILGLLSGDISEYMPLHIRRLSPGTHVPDIATANANDLCAPTNSGNVLSRSLRLLDVPSNDTSIGSQADEGSGLHTADSPSAAGDEGYPAICVSPSAVWTGCQSTELRQRYLLKMPSRQTGLIYLDSGTDMIGIRRWKSCEGRRPGEACDDG